jgi:hypothetical protein
MDIHPDHDVGEPIPPLTAHVSQLLPLTSDAASHRCGICQANWLRTPVRLSVFPYLRGMRISAMKRLGLPSSVD